MIDLLKAGGGENIKVFGGGGGVIVPAEIKELHAYGVTRIFSPEDGQKMGLQGMINEVVSAAISMSARAPQRRPKVLAGAGGAGDKRAAGAGHHLLENGAAPTRLKKSRC
jgi:methylmalonyl-CoA mutase